ncbi:hypothetical protein HK104_006136 [Borealophlyctis nickersoniae]|nr:hypothetical protein HK104_006136 [Borealophlyctis nickersoniae]
MSEGGISERGSQSWLAKYKNPAGQVIKPGEQTEQDSLRSADDKAYRPSNAEDEVDESTFRSPSLLKMYYEDCQCQEDRMFQVMGMLNNRSSSFSSEAARLNKEKRNRQGRNLPKFEGDKDANTMTHHWISLCASQFPRPL